MAVVLDTERPDLGGNFRHGDISTHCPVVWKFLVERFAVKSMLDVGCGEGHAVAYFRRLGVIAHGIDGLITNVRRAVTPISLHDLCAHAFVMPVDMVWTCEVAEHIPEIHVDKYLDTLTNGHVIAMTAALPGQDGHHHVNCQPPEYWIEKLQRRGYYPSPDMSILKKLAETEANYTYFRHSGLVFIKE